ncbi:hypothetical protein HK102_000820 [Quaeritorhiza haematococci]|nr:hypothetical protein HK102_000820 [Quaeritorhiza haematococci]
MAGFNRKVRLFQVINPEDLAGIPVAAATAAAAAAATTTVTAGTGNGGSGGVKTLGVKSGGSVGAGVVESGSRRRRNIIRDHQLGATLGGIGVGSRPKIGGNLGGGKKASAGLGQGMLKPGSATGGGGGGGTLPPLPVVAAAAGPLPNTTSTDILERWSIGCREHTDVVSCLVSCEGRFYSAGYDRKIIIYEISHHGDLKLRAANVIHNAHDAAITCMTYGKDADNSWLITGSHDRTVKLWSLDGSLLQRYDGFGDTITAAIYIVPTKTLWITANTSAPIIYDPRSGINVSNFVNIDQDGPSKSTTAGMTIRHLTYVPETNEDDIHVIQLILRDLSASKEPLLIFSGGKDGVIRKWERMQLNSFMYSQEPLIMPRDDKADDLNPNATPRELAIQKQMKRSALRRRVENNWRKSLSSLEEDEVATHARNQVELLSGETMKAFKRQQSLINLNAVCTTAEVSYSAVIGAAQSKGNAPAGKGRGDLSSGLKSTKAGVNCLFYYEELDLLISGNEDNKIYIWGYNQEAVKNVVSDEPGNLDFLDHQTDGVTNRVAGMTLKQVLQDHKDAVTGIVCFPKDGNHWMVSTGWDRRICIWDLNKKKLHDVFRQGSNKKSNSTAALFQSSQQKSSTSLLNLTSMGNKEELAADGIILCLEYAPERNAIAYGSTDKLAYVRRFSSTGSDMPLQVVLQGHEAEVTRIKWNSVHQQWVTGSEDRTIRIWPALGLPCLKVINNDGPVTALCVDLINGCIVTGSQDQVIRVYDPSRADGEYQAVIQRNYVSASWDNTVRIWNGTLLESRPVES